jgi:hypothetical protein
LEALKLLRFGNEHPIHPEDTHRRHAFEPFWELTTQISSENLEQAAITSFGNAEGAVGVGTLAHEGYVFLQEEGCHEDPGLIKIPTREYKFSIV